MGILVSITLSCAIDLILEEKLESGVQAAPYDENLINYFFKTFEAYNIVIKNNLSDALCGTKVFKKSHIENIYEWRNKLNQLDPFGDFDLIFSAAYCGEKILEYPVHYKARIYGTTQIKRFRDGFKLAIYFIKSFALFNNSN